MVRNTAGAKSNKTGLRTCILHIGMPKTGSTSIQHTLGSLERKGPIQYLKLGTSPNHSTHITTIFYDEPTRKGQEQLGFNDVKLKNMLRRRRQDIKDFLELSSCRTLIISSEAFTNKRMVKNISRVREFFGHYFDRFHIVGYVRGPASSATSRFQQRLKGGNVVDKLNIPKYRKMFEPWIETFSDQKLTIRAWKRENFPSQNVVLDFAKIVGLKVSPDSLITQNESLCLEAVALLYAELMSGTKQGDSREFGRAKRRMLEHLMQVKGRKFLIGEKYLRPAILDREDEIQWIENYLGEELMDRGSEEPWAIDHPQELLKIAEEAEPVLYDYVDRNIKPLNGVEKKRSELFEYLRNPETKV